MGHNGICRQAISKIVRARKLNRYVDWEWRVDYYEGESISNQPNLFPVESHLFFFDVIAL